MSYNERLSAFNNAVDTTNEHIKRVKDRLTNPELEANPVKQGLESAGQVAMTGAGLLQLKKGLEDKGLLRRGFKAIASRLGNRPQGQGTGGQGTRQGETGESSGTKAGQSDGSGNADGARTDTGTGSRPAGETEAGQAPPEGPSADTADLPSFEDLGITPRGGTTTTVTRGATPRADVDADPFSSPRTLQQSYGSSATKTTASSGDGVGDALPNRGLTGRATETDGATTGTAGDATDITRATQGGVEEGQGVLSQARALAGRVNNALGGSGTADSNAGQANMVSRAQQGNADAHAQAEDPSTQATRTNLDPNAESQASKGGGANGGGAEEPGAGGSGAGGSGSGSAGAGVADEAEQGASSGIKGALGVEEGLDETLGEVPVLGPILEAGSLLATLGTSIAGLFEPSEKKVTPKVAPGSLPKDVAVGANLKQDSSGAVGAY